MMRFIPCISRSLMAIVSLMLAACTSAPVHYYTLLAPQAAGAVTAVPFLIEVLPVGIPSQVDQMQLVVRQDESTINVLDSERWASPLHEELRSALSIALTQQLGTQEVTGLPRPTGKPVLRVKLEVRRFESRPGHYALLDADWSLGMTQDKNQSLENTRLLCHSSLREPVGNDYTSLINGHQQAIAVLAEQIASTARSWAVSQQTICPAVKN